MDEYIYDNIDGVSGNGDDIIGRDYSTGVPRYEVGRITQLTEPHKSKALETMLPEPPELPSFADSTDWFMHGYNLFRQNQKDCSTHPLQQVFNDVIAQVASGKGQERHGSGKEFMEQPWKHLCDVHGTGFAFGQAQKKLTESQGMTGEARKRELLGSAAYLAMGLLYEFYLGDEK